jgi:hypothetical protein
MTSWGSGDDANDEERGARKDSGGEESSILGISRMMMMSMN